VLRGGSAPHSAPISRRPPQSTAFVDIASSLRCRLLADSVEKVFLADERKFLCGDVRGTTSFHPKSTTDLGDATKCCGGSLKSTFARSAFRILQQYRAWNGRAAQASGLSPAGSRPLGNGMSSHSAVEVCQFRRSFGVALFGAPLQRHKPASRGRQVEFRS
jgi:hypothetical protein